jgi:putative transposase
VSENRAIHAVATMCRVLGVSPSGYHAWVRRTPSRRAREDVVLKDRIVAIHSAAHGTYGAPRIHAELADEGIHVGRKRVARLMHAVGLAGVSRRRFVTTTLRDGARPAPDLVDRTFTADRLNVLWVADITYVPTWAGFVYLAVVLDAFSRRIVGWSMATTLATTLVLDALDMALWQRRPKDVIHHSDQGSQYTSLAFGNRCREAGVRPSMGSVGDAYDNAMAESFFATLECELLDRHRFKTHAAAKMAIFEFIEGFYNPRRRHSALGYLSPADFERRHSGGSLRPRAPELAAVLAPVKARPQSVGVRGDATATADLDPRCARRRLRRAAGTKERAPQGAEQKNRTKTENTRPLRPCRPCSLNPNAHLSMKPGQAQISSARVLA